MERSDRRILLKAEYILRFAQDDSRYAQDDIPSSESHYAYPDGAHR
jgi:hypothetical protein